MTEYAGKADALCAAIVAEYRRRMMDEYLPRITRCVSLLTPDELWKKSGPHNNSVANLLLHLEGNVRQWMLCGLGGAEDDRDRDGEFDATVDSERRSGAELVEALRATVAESVRVAEWLTPTDLLQEKRFQGEFEETGVGAVLHVMEHFSGHAGQIYAYTKQVKAMDLRFYDL